MARRGLTLPAILVVVVVVVVVVVMVVAVVGVEVDARPTYKPTDSEMKRSKSKEATTTMVFLCEIIFGCAISSYGGLINQ